MRWVTWFSLGWLAGAVLPCAANTYTVRNTNDLGPGSLRDAITQANGHAGLDTITFAITNVTTSAVKTITPASALPVLSNPVIIDGYTQPGATSNTLANADNAVLLIELNESNTGSLTISLGGSGSTIRGLVINRALGVGISLSQATNCIIAGNFIGTDPSGTIALGNTGNGILVTGDGNFIGGGALPGERNLLSGNGQSGIEVWGARGNEIQNNFIGVDATGTAALPNQGNGVFLDGLARDNRIGGLGQNVISGNHGDGILISFGPVSTIVQGNFIGTDVTGTRPLGNGGIGVEVSGQNNPSSGNHLIGGTAAGTGNVISANTSHGVLINGQAETNDLVWGNFIGTDVTGTNALGNGADGVAIVDAHDCFIGGGPAGAGNRIAYNGLHGIEVIDNITVNNRFLQNSIFDNGGLGINLQGDDLFPSHVTLNDPGDGDNGPNQLQNFPVIGSVVIGGGNVTLAGALDSQPNAVFHLEFFSNSSCDASDHGEGQVFLGTTNVTTDAGGNATFSVTLTNPAGHANFIATATDPNGNTSEFSACSSVSGPCSIVCPGNLVVSTAPNQCGAAVSFIAATSGNCGAVSNFPPSGSFFPKGITTVTCTTASGSNCTFTVTVNDTIPPTITCPANIVSNVPPSQTGAVVNYPAPVVSDNCGVAFTNCSPPSGSLFPLGVTTVTCTATDTSGNANTCSFTVTIAVTNTPPVAQCHTVTTNADAGCQANVSPAAVDNGSFDPDGTITNRTLTPPGPFAKGTNQVTLTVFDDRGASNSCTANIIVVDTTPPTISCPADLVTNAPHGQSSVIVTYPAPTVSDNCLGVTTNCVPASGSAFPLGVTTVTCTATDASGNTNSCAFTVTVNPTPATLTWDGGGGNGFWTNAANWIAGVAPVAGDGLVFPKNATQLAATNTTGGPTTLGFLTFSGATPAGAVDYSVSSPPLTLFGGLTNTMSSASITVWSAITLAGDQAWRLSPGSKGTLTLVSNLTLLNHKLTLNVANTTINLAGNVTGLVGSQLAKDGDAILGLSGPANDLPDLSVRGGELIVSGVLTGGLSISNGATLIGAGTVPPFVCDGTVAPGHAGPLTVSGGAPTFRSGSTFKVSLAGSASPGVDYDQLKVSTPPDLSGASLSVVSTYSPAVGETFVIITNTGAAPFTTTFAGLPEGARLVAGGLGQFRITYAGGNGNDVVLTRIIALDIEPVSANAVRLIWATNPPGFNLEGNTNLLGTNWQPVSPLPTVVGSNNVVTNATAGEQRFYRVKK